MWVKESSVSTVAAGVLEVLGASPETAGTVTCSLLKSDRRGAATHGLGLLPLYVDMVHAGVINPLASPTSERISDCLARVDGQGAFGQLTAEHALQLGMQMLPKHGMAAVAIKDGTHLGRLGEWAERACEQGAIFLAFTNTAGGALNVSGPGSTGRVLSTNPLAIGIPTFDALDSDVIVDFATSQVSGSRIREVANSGGKLDPGWVIKNDGTPTDDPEDFLGGLAALLPLGGLCAGHKGFGLTVANEMLAALAGGMMAGERDSPWFSNGALFCFLDVARFISRKDWGERSRQFSDYLGERGCRLPGTGRAASGEQESEQLDLSVHTLSGLLKLATENGINTLDLQVPADAATGSVTQTW